MSDEPKAAAEKFLVFGAPSIKDAEIDEVVASLKSGWLGTGPKVARFEADFANYKSVEANQVAALNSCTAALHTSMIAAGIGPGDEVITSALTFCATVNAIIHSGATPVLADVDAKTMNISPKDIESRITAKTRAIVPVHMAGRPCEMDQIMDIARRHELLVIEDCAHAIETEFAGIKAGNFGDFGCFSFYVTKNVVTGEGGMVVAKREEHISRIKVLSLHGMSKDAWHRFGDEGYRHYQVVSPGFKYNMMDIQAALGIHQLARIEENWLRRQEIWQRYQQAFTELPVDCPTEPAVDTRHAYHLYTLRIGNVQATIGRDDFLSLMTEQGIGIGVHYLSIPEHEYYRDTYHWKLGDFPNAANIGQQTVSLPLSAAMTKVDVERVISVVSDLFLNHRIAAQKIS
ncbi:MAG: DegT/DnrJ/EryC1/StrS family aminotransferase [Thiohalomonadales bacterium]